jgi:hypothetical protein
MFFKINDKLAMGAEGYQTRYSWGHKAHLYRVHTPEHDDEHIYSVKVTYYNRTWERYEFESALYHLIDRAFANKVITREEADTCNDYIKNYQDIESARAFKTIANVAKMGAILASDQKGANDFKARILKAGLEDKGLIMPEDWDTLSEDDKQARLDGAISMLEK